VSGFAALSPAYVTVFLVPSLYPVLEDLSLRLAGGNRKFLPAAAGVDSTGVGGCCPPGGRRQGEYFRAKRHQPCIAARNACRAGGGPVSCA